MTLTPEMIALLPPELRQEMERRLCALLLDLGVKPMITPDGHKVFDIAELAPAIGMSVDEAMAIAEEAGHGALPEIDPDTLSALQ